MLITLETIRNFSLLERAMEQLKVDFIKCNPDGVISEDPDLSQIKNDKTTLVALKEPYHLIDCMTSTATKSREFIYQVINYLHQENHHLTISLIDFKYMNRRLKTLTESRIKLFPAKFRVLSLTGLRGKSGILGKDNLWEIITAPPETLSESSLEPEENLDNKVLVTIESQSGREDYLVEPEKPFTIEDGRVITITLPDIPDIL